ncbi:ATPase [Primorskyibacter aestuariivivens]|uniref:ATPase n=1 Tax=Primorskyibacter aestuariivivens TaxID=1888912 RepID=UPI0023010E5B|nr:ATPase [Primorskyibacter aestuariivivens]MDA7427626.1 ATPase [Primorskyibacter aestuariivivens]
MFKKVFSRTTADTVTPEPETKPDTKPEVADTLPAPEAPEAETPVTTAAKPDPTPEPKKAAEDSAAPQEAEATEAPHAPERESKNYEYPSPPKEISETGLSESFLLYLTCKIMMEGGTMTPAQIANVICLPKLVVRQVIKIMSHKQLVEAQGLESEDIKSDVRYSLTDLGHAWAREANALSQYVGPAPVTLEMFEKQIRRQSILNEEIHRSELDAAFSHLVIPDILKAQLGPAANSGRSMLLWGEPGNGKTSLAEALGHSLRDRVYFPHAILVGNQIIKFYDETLHEPFDLPKDGPRLDPRWMPCHRPVVIAGGELTLDMLDLRFEETARFYEAPMHLKALGGIFVLDDFGRQLETPQAYLNRWIVPLEKGFDILSLHTGKKFMVPFDQLVVFSSNMQPEELGDDAALRRIYFKIFVPSPTREDYMQIFRDVCKNVDLEWNQEVMDAFFTKRYDEGGFVTSGAHPGFLSQHIIAACRYLDREPELSMELLDLAWRNVAASKKRNIRPE